MLEIVTFRYYKQGVQGKYSKAEIAVPVWDIDRRETSSIIFEVVLIFKVFFTFQVILIFEVVFILGLSSFVYIFGVLIVYDSCQSLCMIVV